MGSTLDGRMFMLALDTGMTLYSSGTSDAYYDVQAAVRKQHSMYLRSIEKLLTELDLTEKVIYKKTNRIGRFILNKNDKSKPMVEFFYYTGEKTLSNRRVAALSLPTINELNSYEKESDHWGAIIKFVDEVLKCVPAYYAKYRMER